MRNFSDRKKNNSINKKKKQFTYILLLIFTLSLPISANNKLFQSTQPSTTANCSTGCLRCNPSSLECELCDNYSLFSLQNGKCLKTQIQNCEFSNEFGICNLCSSYHSFDLNTLQCEQVTETIPNCEYYSSSPHQCLQCEEGFQLHKDSNNCYQIQPVVSNCLFYQMEVHPGDSSSDLLVNFPHCLQCEANHYLSLDGTKCLQISQQNCLGIHNTKCIEFKPNYAYHYSFINYENMSRNQGWLDDYLEWVYSPLLHLTSSSSNYLSKFKMHSRSHSVFNCMRLIDSESCSLCHPEFSLNLFNLQCEYSPIKNIRHCLHFDSLNEVCLDCVNSYQLYNGICVSQISLENCTQFDSTHMKCKKCNSGYFFSEVSLTCQKISEILFCTQYDSNYEKCLKCQDSFKVEQSSQKCIYDIEAYPVPEHCSNFNLYSAQCVKCKPGYLLSSLQENKCVVSETAVEHCQDFSSDDDSVCEQCKEGFVLVLPAKGACQEIKEIIRNCEEMSADGVICTSCEEGFKPSADFKQCLFSAQMIDFCEEVDIQSETCNVCMANYLPSSDSKHCEYQQPQHCIETEQDQTTQLTKCSKCNENHILNPNEDKCLIKIQNCQTNSIENGEIKCSQCEPNHTYHDLTKICYQNIPDCQDIIVDEQVSYDSSTSNDQSIYESHLNGKFYQFKCCHCSDGFIHSTDKLKCMKQIDNCLKTKIELDSEQQEYLTCEQCSENFIPMQSSTQCQRSILHCAEHFLSSSIVQADDGTEIFSKEVKCSRCHEGFFHNLDQSECYFVINGCVDYQTILNKTQINEINFLPCEVCHDGLVLSENQFNCLVNIPFCDKHQFETLIGKIITQKITCETCANNYRPNQQSSECLPSIAHCKEYSLSPATHFSSISVCHECDSGYILSTDSTKCFQEISNCERYETQSHFFSPHLKCIQCKDRFELSADLRTCTPLIDNCIEYSEHESSSTCSKCRSPFSLSPSNDKCLIDGCLSYEGEQCKTCKYGFSLLDGQCHSLIENCITYLPTQNSSSIDINKLVCTECEFQFELSPSQTKCLSPFPNCAKFSMNPNKNQLECSECLPGYLLNPNESVCDSPFLNCQYVDPSGSSCLECFEGYEFDAVRNYCVATNCDQFTSSGQCEQCWNDDSKFRFELNQEKYCVEKNPNCDSFANLSGQETGFCQACKSGFSGNDCSESSNGNCAEYDDSSICQKCKENYYLKYNSCFIENCSYLARSTCMSCKAGYVASDDLSQCISPLEHCSELDPDNSSVCSKCEMGYTLDLTQPAQCISSIPNCSKFVKTSSDEIKCSQCQTNYFYNWRFNLCVNQVPNCQTLSEDKQTCASCQPDYELSNKCFTMSTEGCVEMEFGFKCTACATGYVYLSSIFGCVPSVFNCLFYNDHRSCSKCVQGKEPSFDGKCFSENCSFTGEDTNCSGCVIDKTYTMGNEEHCLFCKEGFELDGEYVCRSSSCSQYQFDSSLNSFICSDCASSGQLFNNMDKCLAYSSPCSNFQSTGLCSDCADDYSLLNNVCLKPSNTQNTCAIEYTSPSSSDSFCYKPEIGYYFDSSSGTPQPFIKHCQTFANQEYCSTDCQCQQCEEGYEVFQDNFKRQICVNSSTNISRNNHESSISPIYASVEFIRDADSRSIAQSRVLEESTDETCAWDYYYVRAQQKCVERSVIDPNCIDYYGDRDGCNQCKDGFYQTTTERCGQMPHYQTQNCLKYNKAIQEEDRTILIMQYNQLSILKMSFMSKNLSQRISYDQHLNQDFIYICSVCERGFYLTEEYQCAVLPENQPTLDNCFSYRSDYSCLRCQPNYYLKYEEKEEMKAQCEYSVHLSNCQIARSAFTCSQCEMGFSLVIKEIDGQTIKVCELDLVDNCQEFHQFEGKLICSKCADDYFPSSVQFVEMAKFIQENTYNEYISVSSSSPYKFLELTQFSTHHTRGLEHNIAFTNTHLNSNYKFTSRQISKCSPVESPIEHCLEYSSDSTCRFCHNNYILSSSGSKCLLKNQIVSDEITSNSKCLKLQENKDGCNICTIGFYFNTDSDKCEQCRMKGCLMCTQTAPSDCEICQKGFYMDVEGQCLANDLMGGEKDGSQLNNFEFGDDAVQIIESSGLVDLFINKDPSGNIICSEEIARLGKSVLAVVFMWRLSS